MFQMKKLMKFQSDANMSKGPLLLNSKEARRRKKSDELIGIQCKYRLSAGSVSEEDSDESSMISNDEDGFKEENDNYSSDIGTIFLIDGEIFYWLLEEGTHHYRAVNREMMNRESHNIWKGKMAKDIIKPGDLKLKPLPVLSRGPSTTNKGLPTLSRGPSTNGGTVSDSLKMDSASFKKKKTVRPTVNLFYDRDGKPANKEKLKLEFTIPVATSVNNRIKEYASFILSSYEGAYDAGK